MQQTFYKTRFILYFISRIMSASHFVFALNSNTLFYEIMVTLDSILCFFNCQNLKRLQLLLIILDIYLLCVYTYIYIYFNCYLVFHYINTLYYVYVDSS